MEGVRECILSIQFYGLKATPDSERATIWTQRLKHSMHEVTLETDRFRMTLVFHAILHRKISDDTSTISQTIVPLS
jgi:hypothetical protein